MKPGIFAVMLFSAVMLLGVHLAGTYASTAQWLILLVAVEIAILIFAMRYQ